MSAITIDVREEGVGDEYHGAGGWEPVDALAKRERTQGEKQETCKQNVYGRARRWPVTGDSRACSKAAHSVSGCRHSEADRGGSWSS